MVDRLIYLANESKFPGVFLADQHVPSLDPVCGYDILVIELNHNDLEGNDREPARHALLNTWLEPMIERARDPAFPSLWPLDFVLVFMEEHDKGTPLMVWFRDAICALFQRRLPQSHVDLTVHLVAPPDPSLGFEITPKTLTTAAPAQPPQAQPPSFGFIGRVFARLLKKHWSEAAARHTALWVPHVLNIGVPLWCELLLVSLLYVSDLVMDQGCVIYMRLPVLAYDHLNAEYGQGS